MKCSYTYSRSWPGRDNLLNNLLLRLLHALSVDVMLDYWNVKEYWGCFSQACMRMHRWLKNVNSLLVTQWTLLEKENIPAKVQFVWSLEFLTDWFVLSFTLRNSFFLYSFTLYIFIHPSIYRSVCSSVLPLIPFVRSFLLSFVHSSIHLRKCSGIIIVQNKLMQLLKLCFSIKLSC